MNKLPIMSVSGIRGIYKETIDESFVSVIAYIQTKIAGGGTMIIGRDTRPSGASLAQAIAQGVVAAGGTPVDIGIAATPTVCVAVAHQKASGGVIITASHNPGQYNGYKMVHRTGRLCCEAECNAVYAAFHKNTYDTSTISDTRPSPATKLDATKIHIDRILAAVDVSAIRNAHMSIAVDSINGAGGVIFPQLLQALGVGWFGVHNKLDGDFVHNPEPRPEHLTDLAACVKSHPECWGGFVFDPDADRLATMDEYGTALSEEHTLALALENVLARKLSPVATNLSTSMVIDDVAHKFGVAVIRTKIGEANVVEGIQKNGCLIGGEGNGGVIFPAVSTVRDGLVALALILERMAMTGKKLSVLESSLKNYPVIKEKIQIDDTGTDAVIERVRKSFPEYTQDTQDGLKLIGADGWVHLRPSNTEPILRLIAEASTQKRCRELADMVLQAVKQK